MLLLTAVLISRLPKELTNIFSLLYFFYFFVGGWGLGGRGDLNANSIVAHDQEIFAYFPGTIMALDASSSSHDLLPVIILICVLNL